MIEHIYIAFKYNHYYPAGGMNDSQRIFVALSDEEALSRWVDFSEPDPYGTIELVRLDLDRDPPEYTSLRAVERDA